MSVVRCMIRTVDVFDGEPYFGLLPRRWVRPFGYAVLIAVAVYSPARLSLIDQAERHVVHEVQPMLDRLVEQSSAVPPRDPSPAPSRSARNAKP